MSETEEKVMELGARAQSLLNNDLLRGFFIKERDAIFKKFCLLQEDATLLQFQALHARMRELLGLEGMLKQYVLEAENVENKRNINMAYSEPRD